MKWFAIFMFLCSFHPMLMAPRSPVSISRSDSAPLFSNAPRAASGRPLPEELATPRSDKDLARTPILGDLDGTPALRVVLNGLALVGGISIIALLLAAVWWLVRRCARRRARSSNACSTARPDVWRPPMPPEVYSTPFASFERQQRLREANLISPPTDYLYGFGLMASQRSPAPNAERKKGKRRGAEKTSDV